MAVVKVYSQRKSLPNMFWNVSIEVNTTVYTVIYCNDNVYVPQHCILINVWENIERLVSLL